MELVNRITVKKDGVYVSSRDSEEPEAYRSHYSEMLTRVYEDGGQRALDQKIFEMINEMDIEMRGNHASVRRYEEAAESPEGMEIRDAYRVNWEACFDRLSEEDKRNRWTGRLTPGLKEFYTKNKEYEQIMYRQLAEICSPVQKKVKEIKQINR